MNRPERPEAALCRQWARRLRREAANPGAYQQGWLHTRRLPLQGTSLDRYCAYGYAVETASGKPQHNEMWGRAESEDFNGLLVYADAGLAVTRPDIETINCFGLWPARNPVALMIWTGRSCPRNSKTKRGRATYSSPPQFCRGSSRPASPESSRSKAGSTWSWRLSVTPDSGSGSTSQGS